MRKEYLFPAPAGPLRSLLDRAAASGAEFTEEEAALDAMLAIDRDDLKPIRYLAGRWSWSASRVHRKLTGLRETAGAWRRFYAGQDETTAGQSETRTGSDCTCKAGSETLAGQSETDLGQYSTDPDNRTREGSAEAAPADSPEARLSRRQRRVAEPPCAASRAAEGSTPHADGSTETSGADFSDEDWQLQAARFAFKTLEAAECVDRPLQKPGRRREDALQKWADTFDKLVRIDGYSKAEIGQLLRWLARPGNWWTETKNVRSFQNVRLSRQGTRKIDQLFASMEGDRKSQQTTQPGLDTGSFQ